MGKLGKETKKLLLAITIICLVSFLLAVGISFLLTKNFQHELLLQMCIRDSWGTPADIAPYMDKDFSQNVLLTQTERITMSSRPKEPKYARNKNILVCGGSGSGKTRFFVKPNLLQCHSSYVVTDPKGTILNEVGALLDRKGYRLSLIHILKSISPARSPAKSQTRKILRRLWGTPQYWASNIRHATE